MLIVKILINTVCKRKYVILRERILKEHERLLGVSNTNLDLLTRFLISGEDHRYYYHPGFDLIAIARAIKNRFLFNKVEGASTIEQQLVRVLTGSFERTLRRKLEEVLLAAEIKAWIVKEDVAKIYLSVAYYGYGMNGLEQAFKALEFDEKTVLDQQAAAALIARLKYPQPKDNNEVRRAQIEARKRHLIRLYNKHSRAKFFKVYG